MLTDILLGLLIGVLPIVFLLFYYIKKLTLNKIIEFCFFGILYFATISIASIFSYLYGYLTHIWLIIWLAIYLVNITICLVILVFIKVSK